MIVKKEFEFDDCVAVDAGLKNLRRYNQAMYISLDQEYIDSSLVEKYFRAEEGSVEEAVYEDALSAAAICCCNDDPDIPQKYKKKVGDRMHREYIASLRASKVDFLFHSGELGMPTTREAEHEREARHKDIAIVQKAHYLDKVTKTIRKRGTRIVQKEGIKTVLEVVTDNEPTIKWTTRILMCATSLIPQKVKEKTKETANKAYEYVANTVSYHASRLANTTVGQKVLDVYEKKVEPVLKKGYEVVSKTCSTIAQGVKSMWKRLKSIFA
ncbi:MAG: hypothetical protein KBT20_07650 [Bacteroidales bacterium]|nr:hypothetical protein [Candidatus Liminaster caballi]